MNRIERILLVGWTISGALAATGIIVMVATKDFSLFNLIPIGAGGYFALDIFLKYRGMKGKDLVEYEMKLEDIDSTGAFGVTKEYRFSGRKDGVPVDFYINGEPRLQDSKGNKLKAGNYYRLTYLAEAAQDENPGIPISIVKIKGFVERGPANDEKE